MFNLVNVVTLFFITKKKEFLEMKLKNELEATFVFHFQISQKQKKTLILSINRFVCYVKFDRLFPTVPETLRDLKEILKLGAQFGSSIFGNYAQIWNIHIFSF